MADGIRERISVAVSLVIAAVDDFSGRPVKNNQLRVWIEGEKKPIAKEGGNFIFTNLRAKDVEVHLEGPMFYSRSIVIHEKELEQYEGKSMKVRMLPNQSYLIPRGTTCVQGHAPLHTTVMAYHKTMENPLKLLYAYEAGAEEISIFHSDEIDLEGGIFFIRDKEGKNQEIFQILSVLDTEKKVYRPAAALHGSYKKIGTAIYPVYMSKTDKDGSFYLPVSGVRTQKDVFAFWLEGQENEIKEVELTGERQNRLDFR